MDTEAHRADQSNTAAMDTEAHRADQSNRAAMDPSAPTRAQRRLETCAYVILVAISLFMAGVVLSTIVEGIMYKEPNYSVAIASVSGLDPATDLGRRPALEPEFNLTVVVAPRSSLMHSCGFPGTTARVSYHGFDLASAAVPKFCEIRGTRTVIARGARVWLPAPALDSLAADLRHAGGVFDVTFTIPNTGYYRGVMQGLVISCMGRRVGEDVDGGAALCDLRETELRTFRGIKAMAGAPRAYC